MDWKVEATATVEGGGEGKLKECSFSDDLSGIDSGYDEATKTLPNSFPDDVKGT